MNLRYMMFCRTLSSVWKLPEVKVKHCGLLQLTQSEAGACDQENFVENSIGHDRYNPNLLKSKDADVINLWYFISQRMLWNFGHCCEWGLFCIVFYGSPCHKNDTLPVRLCVYTFCLLNNRVSLVPKYYYTGNRKSHVLHTRLRINCSSLNRDLFLKRVPTLHYSVAVG